MRLIVDTAPIVSVVEPNHPDGPSALRVLLKEPDELIMPAPVTAEIDYFLQARGGPTGNRTFLRDLAARRYYVPCLEPADYSTLAALNEQYRDLNVGLVDLSIIVIAARFRTTRILTFDQRHFRAMRPLQGGVFTLLPYDEPIP